MCASFVVLRGEARLVLAAVVWERLHGNKSGTLNDGMFAQIGKKCSSILGLWSMSWKQHDVSMRQREDSPDWTGLYLGADVIRRRLEHGGLWKKGWRLWTSRSEWVGATESYRAGVTWANCCFGERIASPFSFSLAVELTCSCKRLGHIPCPGGTHLQDGHIFHSNCFFCSVRKHPPGAWVYSFKVQNASYCKARGENPVFQFFSSSSSFPNIGLLPQPLRILTFGFFLFP